MLSPSLYSIARRCWDSTETASAPAVESPLVVPRAGAEVEVQGGAVALHRDVVDDAAMQLVAAVAARGEIEGETKLDTLMKPRA